VREMMQRALAVTPEEIVALHSGLLPAEGSDG
jgi:hypothetical protein